MIKCNFENGNQANLRHVVTGVVLVKDKMVLLGRRGTYKGKPILEFGKWGIIGGFLDRNENLEEGIRREIREETGWEVDNLELLHINDIPDKPGEDRQNVAMVFFANPVKQEAVETEEVTELKWFDLNDLPPKAEIAFDHIKEIELYKRYLREKFKIPVIG